MTAVSLFAGIGGFDLAMERCGIEVVACVEIDLQCRKLLASKLPDAIIHDDVTTFGKEVLRGLDATVDIITFGFPCQDLSVAGKRTGLKGERSGLFYEATRIIDEFRPTWAVWENVPGLLSSDNGRDFAAVLHEMDRIGYHGAWRTLNSQYLGVAQRRRRVFGVFTRGDSGAAGCAEILSIAEGLRGHPLPSRKEGQGVARDIAPCLRGGGIGTQSPTDSRGQDCVIPVVSRTITANEGHGGIPSTDGLDGKLIPVVSGTLTAGAHPSGFNGQDAYNDRLIVDTFPREGRGYYTDGDIASTVRARDCKDASDLIVVKTANTKSNGDNISATGVSYTLDGAPNQAVLAFDMTHADDPARLTGDAVNTLQARMGTGGNQVPCVVAFNPNAGARARSVGATSDLSPTLTNGVFGVASIFGVRRLTVTECERLQSFPDGWTDGFADSVRYRMLGNAVTVNVVEWIMRRLVRVHNKEGKQ